MTMANENRYFLIVTDQVPESVVAEWLEDDLFRAYYDSRQRRGKKCQSL